jgi:hypothetical protein
MTMVWIFLTMTPPDGTFKSADYRGSRSPSAAAATVEMATPPRFHADSRSRPGWPQHGHRPGGLPAIGHQQAWSDGSDLTAERLPDGGALARLAET